MPAPTSPAKISTIQQRLTTHDVTNPAAFTNTVAGITTQLLGTLDAPNIHTFRLWITNNATGAYLIGTVEDNGRSHRKRPVTPAPPIGPGITNTGDVRDRKAVAAANRALYPRNGNSWETWEDELLTTWVNDGPDTAGLAYLATELQRTPSGVGQRAVKLGLTGNDVTGPLVRALRDQPAATT